MGTTDSYTTQPVSALSFTITIEYYLIYHDPQGELEHCHVKHQYPHTPKKKDQTLISTTSREGIEQLVQKVIAAYTAQQENPRP
jgi:hypothetical protein